MKLSKILANFNRDMYGHAKEGFFYVVDKLNRGLKYLAIEQKDGSIKLLCRHCVTGGRSQLVTCDELDNRYMFAYSEETF